MTAIKNKKTKQKHRSVRANSPLVHTVEITGANNELVTVTIARRGCCVCVSLPRLRIPSVCSAADGPGRCPVLKRRADQAAKTSDKTLDDYTSTTCYGGASA